MQSNSRSSQHKNTTASVHRGRQNQHKMYVCFSNSTDWTASSYERRAEFEFISLFILRQLSKLMEFEWHAGCCWEILKWASKPKHSFFFIALIKLIKSFFRRCMLQQLQRASNSQDFGLNLERITNLIYRSVFEFIKLNLRFDADEGWTYHCSISLDSEGRALVAELQSDNNTRGQNSANWTKTWNSIKSLEKKNL